MVESQLRVRRSTQHIAAGGRSYNLLTRALCSLEVLFAF